MKHISLLLSLVAASVLFSGCSNDETATSSTDTPLMMLRLRGTATFTDEAWDNTFRIVKENPGCCDELWFSTGLGFPSMDIHRERAERVKRGTQELKEIGVGASLQVQMTIGHGDDLAKGEEHLYSELTWTRWTGSTGVVDKYCSCPRDPQFLEYMREMSHIYAETHPRSVWLDDDLRYDNHSPATNGSHIGCWCDRCIGDFNAATGGNWTAKTLSEAIRSDEELYGKWEQFSISSLEEIAHVIGGEFVKVSPETRLGLQGGMDKSRRKMMEVAILKALHETSGRDICFRPGGGMYYDDVNADIQIVKSMQAANFRKELEDFDWIAEWCPEIETWPRVYGSRTPQGALVEGFISLAYGLNSVSLFVMAPEKESPEVYSQTMLRPLSLGSPMLKAYFKANEGTVPVGYSSDQINNRLYKFSCSAIPVLPGLGKDLGPLSAEDIGRPRYTTEVSGCIQDLREELNARSASPVVCCSPFIGMVIPRVNADGTLRTIGMQNVRIDAQGPVKLRLQALPEGVKTVQWHEMKKDPVKLSVTTEGGQSYVTVPELSAWNCGYLRID